MFTSLINQISDLVPSCFSPNRVNLGVETVTGVGTVTSVGNVDESMSKPGLDSYGGLTKDDMQWSLDLLRETAEALFSKGFFSERDRDVIVNKCSLNDVVQNSVISRKDSERVSALEKKMMGLIAKQLMAKGDSKTDATKTAKKTFAAVKTAVLNKRPWNVVKDSFSFKGIKCETEVIPAKEMKSVLSQEPLLQGYSSEGISHNTEEIPDHVRNLWLQKLQINGKPIMQITRHAVVSHKTPQTAAEAAKEILTAALNCYPKKMKEALSGEPVNLTLVSVNLLSPVDEKILYQSNEKTLLGRQMDAWEYLRKQSPITFTIPNENRELTTVTVEPTIAAFNFGVTDDAVGHWKRGHAESNKYNEKAAKILLGDIPKNFPEQEIGGLVGDYLKTKPANEDSVRKLANAVIGALKENEKTPQRGKTLYQLPALLLRLSYEIGLVPDINCKSGKDRTAIAIPLAIAGMIESFLAQEYGIELSDSERQKLFEQCLLHTGQGEVQRQNTGKRGNKTVLRSGLRELVMGITGLRELINHPDVVEELKGGARFA